MTKTAGINVSLLNYDVTELEYDVSAVVIIILNRRFFRTTILHAHFNSLMKIV